MMKKVFRIAGIGLGYLFTTVVALFCFILLVCLVLSLFLFGMAQAEEILLPGQIQDTLSSAPSLLSEWHYLPLHVQMYHLYISSHQGQS